MREAGNAVYFILLVVWQSLCQQSYSTTFGVTRKIFSRERFM